MSASVDTKESFELILEEGPGGGLAGPDEAVEAKEHWQRADEFVLVERERRDSRQDASSNLFLSHCWRKRQDNLQARKRRCIAKLSAPVPVGGAMKYWGDFLDLQAEGPVPWRQEIEEGIEKCSKMGWLTSFNCLQELAFAIREEKPVVVLAMDQEAWDLLTVPNGHERAWAATKHGPPLSSYEGHEIIPGGDKFDKDVAARLFGHLASINLCPLRPMDEGINGPEAVLSTMLQYVQKDLSYFKKHAELKALACKWDFEGRPSGLLLNPGQADQWATWVQASDDMAHKPEPSELQRSLVNESTGRAIRTRRRRRALGLAALVLILLGAVGSVVAAVLASGWAETAQANAEIAGQNEEKAVAAASNATSWATTAMANEEEALYQRDTVVAWALTGSAQGASAVELRALGSALGMLEGPAGGRQDLQAVVMSSFREQMAGGYAMKGLLRPTLMASQATYPPTSFAEFSPDGSKVQACGISGWAIFDATTGEQLANTVDSAGLEYVPSWHPSSPLIGFHHDDQVLFWELDNDGVGISEDSVVEVEGHAADITCAIFSPDGDVLASGDGDGVVNLWSGRPPYELIASLAGAAGGDGNSSAAVLSLAWSPAAAVKQLAAGRDDGTVSLWVLLGSEWPAVVVSSVILQTLTVPSPEIGRVEFSPTGDAVAFGSSTATGGPVWVADLSGPPVGTLGRDGLREFTTTGILKEDDPGFGLDGRCSSFKWLPTARTLACVPAASPIVIFWDLWVLSDPFVALKHEFPERVSAITFRLQVSTHPRMITGHAGGLVIVSDILDTIAFPWVQRELRGGHKDTQVDCVAFDPAGDRALSVGLGENQIGLWDLSVGEQKATHAYLGDPRLIVYASDWSADGAMLATGHQDGTVRVHYTPAGVLSDFENSPMATRLLTFHQADVQSVAWAPSGHRLASGSWDTLVAVWDLDGPAPVRPQVLRGHTNWLRKIAWHPSGGMIATGAEDAVVLIWEDDGSEAFQLSHTLLGHTRGIRNVVFSPVSSRRLLASSDRMGLVLVHDLDLEPSAVGFQQALSGHVGAVRGLGWSPLGDLLASGGKDGTLRIWGGLLEADAVEQHVLESHDGEEVNVVAWSHNGTWLASGGWDASISIWTASDFKAEPKSLTKHTGWISGLAWSPTEEMILVSSAVSSALIGPSSVGFWDVARSAGSEALYLAPAFDLFNGGSSLVASYSVAFHPSGKFFSTTGNELQFSGGSPSGISPDGRTTVSGGNAVRIWKLVTGSYAKLELSAAGQFDVGHNPSDGSVIASCFSGGHVQLWDTSTAWGPRSWGGLHISERHGHQLWRCPISPDGSRIATGADDGSVRVHELEAQGHGTLLSTQIAPEGHLAQVDSIVWTADSRGFVSASSSESSMRMYAIVSGLNHIVLHRVVDFEDTEWSKPRSLAMSNTGHLLAVALINREVLVYNTAEIWSSGIDALEVSRLIGHEGNIRAISFSPSGDFLASAAYDNTVRLWDVASAATLQELLGHTSPVMDTDWAADGQHVVSVSQDGTARLWAVSTDELSRVASGTLPAPENADVQILDTWGNWMMGVSLSPDSSEVAVSGFNYYMHLYKYLRPELVETLLKETLMGPTRLLAQDFAALGLPGVVSSVVLAEQGEGDQQQ